jgi:hypothetical protein
MKTIAALLAILELGKMILRMMMMMRKPRELRTILQYVSHLE